MRVAAARAVAADWVHARAAGEPWFGGAYLAGSIVGLPDDADLPATSDVDVVVVAADGQPLPPKPGKTVHHGVLLDVSYQRMRTPAAVLASYRLASAFRVATVLADPTGGLRRLQAEVAAHFAEPASVRGRCADVLRLIEADLQAAGPLDPWPDQVTAWLFATGKTAHLPLVAACRNPTVRRRYVAAREVLSAYGGEDLYEDLLALLGCRDLTPERVERHLGALAQTFDAAAAVARTPFPFSSDITAGARPIAIDGSLELIRAGLHREAMFWIVATFARCQKILAADAPPGLQEAHAPAFAAVLADLGTASPADLARRGHMVIAILPRLEVAAEGIIAARGEAG